jgi:hypothetical protein
MPICKEQQTFMVVKLFEDYLKSSYEHYSKEDNGYLVFINSRRIFYKKPELIRSFNHKNREVFIFKISSFGSKTTTFNVILKKALGRSRNNNEKFEDDDNIFFPQLLACTDFLYSNDGMANILLNHG